jgi:hypothetical protein
MNTTKEVTYLVEIKVRELWSVQAQDRASAVLKALAHDARLLTIDDADNCSIPVEETVEEESPWQNG